MLNSAGVLVVNSSLTIPAVLFKPTVMVYVDKMDAFQKAFDAMKVCPVVESSYFLEPNSKKWLHNVKATPDARREFLDTFIGGNEDGKALSRLKQILAS